MQMGGNKTEAKHSSCTSIQVAVAAAVCTYTCCACTALQEFPGAERIVENISSAEITITELQQRRIVQDDRIEMTVTDNAVFWHIPGK